MINLESIMRDFPELSNQQASEIIVAFDRWDSRRYRWSDSVIFTAGWLARDVLAGNALAEHGEAAK